MTTLTPFLWPGGKQDTSGQRQAEALNRIVSVLLQGIALHTFNFDPAQFPAFEKTIRKVRSDFEQAPDEATALLAAGAAIRVLEDHGNAAERHCSARYREMQSVVTLLANTLVEVAGAAPEVKGRIKAIGSEITLATDGETLAAARRSLEACLAELRAESLALSETEPSGPSPEKDAVTGLPDAGCAARALNSVWSRRKDYYLAVLALERIETINLRFGFQAGDQMLLQLSQHVAQQLTPEDRLFRWRGPCLVILVHRRVPEALVTAELNRLATARLETGMMFREREVLVPASVSWNLFPLSGQSSAEDLVRQINDFAANRFRSGRRVLAAAM
jgi:GGDEF domain-containing protein